MINLPTSYKLKMISYRAKNILRAVIGKRGERKRARIFSVMAVLAIIILISSISIYGFGLKGGAEGNTNISAAGDIINKYNYNFQGVSIHTKAETLVGGVPRGDATVVKGKAPADVVRFTLTVSNSDVAKPVDVKFALPTEFTYVGSLTYSGGINCSAATVSLPAPGANGPMSWTGCIAQPGDSTIVFNTNGPL